MTSRAGRQGQTSRGRTGVLAHPGFVSRGSAGVLAHSGQAGRGSACVLERSNLACAVVLMLCVGLAAGDVPRVTGLDDLYRPQAPPSENNIHQQGLQVLLDTYQPTMLKVSPELGQPCHQQLTSFLENLHNNTIWALRMWDSSGHYGSQFLWGNNFWLGSLTQCQDLNNNAADELPFPVHFFVASLRLNASLAAPQVRTVYQGLCLPSACSSTDVTSFLSLSQPPGITVLKSRPVPDPLYSIWTQPVFYVAGVLVAVSTVLVVAATILDLVLRRRANMAALSCCPSTSGTAMTVAVQTGEAECNGNHLNYTSTGPDPETAKGTASAKSNNQPGRVAQLFLCFSAVSNLMKICDTSSTEGLACLHGLRVFSLLWVVAGHTCMFAFPFSDNKAFRRLVERDFLFQSISSGAFSVDTFFFISGILVAYVFCKAKVKPAAGSLWCAVRSQLTHFAGVFSYRYCRLVMPYVFALLLNQLTTDWFSRNSVFEAPTLDHENCRSYWWRNLLFINTLFPVKDMCMIWSWYLANDTQFYTLAVIILLISSRYFKFAACSLIVLLVSSWFTTGIISLHSRHVPSIEEPLGLFDQLYDKPWTRLGPYAVGVITGWLLHRIDSKLHLHKAAVVAGWGVSLATTFVLVHGLYGDLGPLVSAAYVSLGHTAWACALAWVVVACCTGNGGYINTFLSAKVWFPLSRLTYCAYLVHPIIMVTAIMHNDSPIHLTRDTMVMTIFGYMVTSYGLSLLVSLAFEAPYIALLNALHPIRRLAK